MLIRVFNSGHDLLSLGVWSHRISLRTHKLRNEVRSILLSLLLACVGSIAKRVISILHVLSFNQHVRVGCHIGCGALVVSVVSTGASLSCFKVFHGSCRQGWLSILPSWCARIEEALAVIVCLVVVKSRVF